ncbi:UvrD-helicase domain-containing protein [Massilia sp. R2A-15]|uniref:UvrD-helicase domain-containing protein n=1 Tax=Massilia sp. R2A-15 TaxID=3064278 RepID=UPI0027363551|nr:UvrD-helicase domain-containing protein [Massilia sp. R2A-15]WLI87844.1 UvrD-helicase domain-containing protein [Massilia sp. R2A-15]
MDRLLVVAGPGAGKTQVSALRLVNLVDAGLTPREILVLSFSRSAVRTLARRIEQLASTAESLVEELRYMSIRTFDSWAFRFLRQMGAQPAELLSASHDQNIQKLIDVLSGPSRSQAFELLSGVRHLIIDEFQDLPGVRGTLVLTLLDLLAPPTRTGVGFTVLGDPAQAIYEFAARQPDAAGARNCWKLLREQYGAGLRQIVLDRNYRSRPELASLSASLRQVLGGDADAGHKLLEVRRQIGLLGVSEVPLGPGWLETIPEGAVAILTRTNGEAMNVAKKLAGSEMEGGPVAVRLQSVGKHAPVPAWIGALLGPLKSTTIVQSQFLKIHALSRDRLGQPTCDAIGLPEAGAAWLRLLRASGEADASASLDMADLRARLNWPDAFPDDAAPSGNGVFISTVHQAKGMEFETVVILESEPDKEDKPEEYPEEEAHVGFVAITRAARQLSRIPPGQIYRAPTTWTFGNGSRQRLCHRWGGWINLAVGISGDIDPCSFVDPEVHGTSDDVAETQALLLEQARQLCGHKVMLVKAAIDTNRYVYNIYLQDDSGPGRLLGRTTAQLTYDLLSVLGGKSPLPGKIYNLRIGDIVTVVGPDETTVAVPAQFRASRLWLGVTLFGTGDFKPFRKA